MGIPMSVSISVSAAADQCILPVLRCLCVKVGYMYDLEDNLSRLRRDLNVLLAERRDVLSRIEAEELKGRRRLAVVATWLSEVHIIETNSSQLLDGVSAQDASAHVASGQDASAQDASAHVASGQDASDHVASGQDASAHVASGQDASAQDASAHVASGQDASAQDASAQDASAVHERLSASGFWSTNINSTYSRSQKVFKMLNEVTSLSLKLGKFGEVTEQAPPPVVEVKRCPQTFGLDSTLQKTWKSLMKKNTKMLGIHGMGGVGKSTLLTLINNKFVEVKDAYDVVIWVKVSKDADTGKIQDKIGKRLGIYDDKWSSNSEREKAAEIGRVLSTIKPRFVLLLDDLWKQLSLTKIGIPLQTGGEKYKVVFTTRFMGVCGTMGANVDIGVKCLAYTDAWELFRKKVRAQMLDEEMLDVAREIVEMCRGLPLALEVIGASMSCRGRNAAGWRRALHTLKSSPSKLEGIEEKMFPVLKLSYDIIQDDDAKSCCRYCALFPEAYNVTEDELVEYWIGEGIIDERQGRESAKDRGYEIIDTLVGVGLLIVDDKKVYMHDMIREMALWIVSESREGERFVVKAGAGLSKLPKGADWKAVTKMSLINNEIKSMQEDSEFPNPSLLITLFLQNNKLEEIVGNFFVLMSTLVVLDLSRNLRITELPEEISYLVSLRYLNLLGTMIKDLPSGFGELGKLIHLDLESTSSLQDISLISGLLSLQVLRFYDSAAVLDLSLLEKLEGMESLELLTVAVREALVLKAFLPSNLAGRTEGLHLDGLKVSGASFAAIFGALRNLRKLEMINCDIVESETEWDNQRRHQFPAPTPIPSPSNQSTPSSSWFKNLSTVVLISCEHLRDLTWLVYAANLESLSISLSPKMGDLISKGKAGDVEVEPFRKLQVFCLDYLGDLRSIYWSPLSFPRLHQLSIKNCPRLHKLPLNSMSVERIDHLRIEVEEGWLERVEWEDGAKDRFLPVIIRTASPV